MSAKAPLAHKVTDSQVLVTRVWTSLGGHYSASHTLYFQNPGHGALLFSLEAMEMDHFVVEDTYNSKYLNSMIHKVQGLALFAFA